jgi:CRISP-associated protein Cas1
VQCGGSAGFDYETEKQYGEYPGRQKWPRPVLEARNVAYIPSRTDGRKMSQQSSSVARARVTSDPRVVVIDDYAFTLCVRRGHVVVKSSNGERVISRMDAAKTRDGIARIIILSHVGTVSMEVLRWASALGVCIYQVSRDGAIGFCTPGLVTADARMYKQQVLAQPRMPNEATGLGIVRELLTAKIAGQLEVLRMMGQDSARIAECITMMAGCKDIRSMLAVEGNAAIAYWKAWERSVFVPWEPAAMKYIPVHWNKFNGRAGVITRGNGYADSSNRNARDFVNACLGYAYKVCETEAMYACYATGLHPALGLSHGAIHEDKPAMTLDLMEPLRPIADRVVLSYMDHGNGIPFDDTGKPAYISEESAVELDDGTCRLFPPMTNQLAATVSMAVAPHAIQWAENTARNLAATAHISIVAPFDPRLKNRDSRKDLDMASTPRDLIPDHVWERVRTLIPEVPPGVGRRSDPRAILAGIVAHEIYGISWPKVATGFHLDWRTCRRRLGDWQETAAWEKIKAEITRPGVSRIDAVG